MNKIRRGGIITLLSIVFTGISAQCVYQEGESVFLDLTEKYGMPKGSTTDIPKYTGTFVGSDSRYLVNKAYSDRENEKMFEKLEIAQEDLPPGNEGLTWAEAFDGCRALGTNWRLPTQCELLFMWIFKVPLGNLTTPFKEIEYDPDEDIGIEYWSATEYEEMNQAWNTDFNTGFTTNSKKEVGKAARCVKDVHP